MDLLLRQNYIQRVVADLSGISGATFERVGYVIADRIAAPNKLWHRGTNLQGAPIGYTVDTFSENGEWIAEYSSEAGYFDKHADIQIKKTATKTIGKQI